MGPLQWDVLPDVKEGQLVTNGVKFGVLSDASIVEQRKDLKSRLNSYDCDIISNKWRC